VWLLKKSLLIGHTSASSFQCEDAERVVQQPQAISLKTPPAVNECNSDITPFDTVEQNSLMKTAEIEAAILRVVGDRWMKVAMVIAKVVEAMGTDLPTGDEGLELVSEHIEILVSTGRIEAQGNTKNWRFSEVRRASSDI
jgi:hypothetical protein